MIFFFLWLLCGVITGSVAYSKNRFWFGWFLLGCIIGIFGVIWIACLPKLEPSKGEDKSNSYKVEEGSTTTKEREQLLKSDSKSFVQWWRGLSRWRRGLGYMLLVIGLAIIFNPFLPHSTDSTNTQVYNETNTGTSSGTSEAVVEIEERMHIWTNEDWTMPGHDRPCLWKTYDKCIEADEIPNREIANNVPVKVLGTPSGTELAEYECVKIRPLAGKFAGEIFYIGVTHLVG